MTNKHQIRLDLWFFLFWIASDLSYERVHEFIAFTESPTVYLTSSLVSSTPSYTKKDEQNSEVAPLSSFSFILLVFKQVHQGSLPSLSPLCHTVPFIFLFFFFLLGGRGFYKVLTIWYHLRDNEVIIFEAYYYIQIHKTSLQSNERWAWTFNRIIIVIDITYWWDRDIEAEHMIIVILGTSR